MSTFFFGLGQEPSVAAQVQNLLARDDLPDNVKVVHMAASIKAAAAQHQLSGVQ